MQIKSFHHQTGIVVDAYIDAKILSKALTWWPFHLSICWWWFLFHFSDPTGWAFLPGRLPKSSQYLLRKCLEGVKAEPQEVFGVPNTDPHKVFGRLGLYFPMIFERIQVFFVNNYLSTFWVFWVKFHLSETNFSASLGFQPLVFSGSTSSSHGPRVNAQQELKARTVTQSTATTSTVATEKKELSKSQAITTWGDWWFDGRCVR